MADVVARIMTNIRGTGRVPNKSQLTPERMLMKQTPNLWKIVPARHQEIEEQTSRTTLLCNQSI